MWDKVTKYAYFALLIGGPLLLATAMIFHIG
jgi:hypothetical protein